MALWLGDAQKNDPRKTDGGQGGGKKDGGKGNGKPQKQKDGGKGKAKGDKKPCRFGKKCKKLLTEGKCDFWHETEEYRDLLGQYKANKAAKDALEKKTGATDQANVVGQPEPKKNAKGKLTTARPMELL